MKQQFHWTPSWYILNKEWIFTLFLLETSRNLTPVNKVWSIKTGGLLKKFNQIIFLGKSVVICPSRDGPYYVIGYGGRRRADGRPHRFPHTNFSSVYRIFTKRGHMIPLWKGKNPIYFGVIQGFQSGPVPGTFTRLRSCIVPTEITEPPKISGGQNHKYDGR